MKIGRRTFLTALFILLGLMILGLLITCSREDSPSSPTGGSTFEEVINNGGEFEEFAEFHDQTEEEVYEDETTSGEIYYCTKTRHTITEGFLEFPLFDPNTSVIWPGNLLQGAYLDEAPPRPIVVSRAGGNIVMTVMCGTDTLSSVAAYLDTVSISAYYREANQIVNNVSQMGLAADVTYEYSMIHSREELELAIGASFTNVTVDIDAKFGYKNDIEYNSMLVKLYQGYYTFAYQLPTSYSQVFGADVTPEDLAKFIQPGNPAAFIESVKYGRIFYLLVQSTSSSTMIDLAVKAFFSGAAGSGGGEFEITSLDTLQSCEISGYAFGGDADKAISALQGNLDSLKVFLESGGTVTSGKPISYVVRSLARPDRIIKVKVATEYDEIDCIPVGLSLDNPIFWYSADDELGGVEVEDYGGSSYVTRMRNIFDETGEQGMDATPLGAGHYGGEWIEDALPSPASGGSKPSVKCYQIPGELDGIFRYFGENKFTDTDYTIFALVKLNNLQIPYPAYFMFGTSSTSFRNLSIGFWAENRLIMSHQGQNIRAYLPQDYYADDYNAYTFRFSMEEGMSIYVNFDNEPCGSDPAKTTPMGTYTEPSLGSSGGYPIEIVEIIAYGLAVSDAQRMAILESLRQKYTFP